MNVLRNIYIFAVVEAGLCLFTLYAIRIDNLNKRRARKGNLTYVIKRGKESLGYLHITFGVLFTLLIMKFIDQTKEIQEYSAFFTLLNFLIILYLTFTNDWFRNKIIGFFSKARVEKNS